MKRVLFLFLVVLLAASCKTPFERALVRDVKKEIKNNLKKPESLQDLVITYACPTQAEIDSAYNNFDYDHYQVKRQEGTYIVVAQYKARNSYNDLVDGFRVFTYFKLPHGSYSEVNELGYEEEHLFKAFLYSKNQKELK